MSERIWKPVSCPKEEWASKAAQSYGVFLPQELENKGRGGTTGKETGTDAGYRVIHEDGVDKLFLSNFCASSKDPNVVLIDDGSNDQKSKATKTTQKRGRRRKAAPSSVSAEQPTKPLTNTTAEKIPKEDPIAKLQAEYREYKPVTANNAYLQKKGVPSVPGLKQDRQDLIMPFSNEKSVITGLQRISPDGKKRFEKGSSLGDSFFVIQGLPDTGKQYVLICEGLATGISLWYSTFCTVVVAGSAGQMDAGTSFAKMLFPGRPVICCADNDRAGGKNVGLEAAKAASLKYGCFLAVPPANEGEKVDFNDLHQKFGRTKVLEVIEEATKLPPVKIPDKFSLTSEGLFVEVEKGQGKYRYTVTEQISKSPLEVRAWAKPLNGEGTWALQVRWQDLDGCEKTALLPNDVMAYDPKLVSSTLGMSYITNWNKYRSAIYEYLMGTETERRIYLADHCGWVQDNLYVTPHRCFGFSPIPIYPNVDVEMAEFTPKGSLDEFRALTQLAQGNHIFIIALCAACAAPLLGLVNVEPGGLHFVGSSSTGKTTALVMATAFWRDPKYISSWNTTDNALEKVAARFHDNFLAIDEISQVTAKALFKSLYTLSNGVGKKRCLASKTGVKEARQNRWRLFYISTGEETPENKIRQENMSFHGGQSVRLATIRVEEGHIRNLHGYENNTAFLTAVRSMSANSYGVAGEKLLEFLTAYAAPLREQLPKIVAMYEAELCAPYCSDGKRVDNQVHRVATRFALCIVGGCLASAWNIIDVPQDEIVQALTDAFASWIEDRGGVESAETRAIVEGTRDLLQEYGERFILCPLKDETHISSVSSDVDEIARRKSITPPKGGIAGYIVQDPGEEGYYVDPTFFTKTLCGKLDKNERLVKRTLVDMDILIPGPEPKYLGTRFTPTWVHGQYTKGKESRKRYYRIFYPELFPTDNALDAGESDPSEAVTA